VLRPTRAGYSEVVFFSTAQTSKGTLTRHEYLVLVVLVGMRKDISALQCLREEPKDVVDNQKCRLRLLGAGGIRLHAIDGDPLALLLVALADDRRNGAASLGLRRHICGSLETVL
jgi:hypothetical protein